MPKLSAPRATFTPDDPADVAQRAAGDRKVVSKGQAKAGLNQFVSIRSPALGAVKIALQHLDVYEAIWLLSERKKGREDHGVTPDELVAHLGLEKRQVYTVMKTLLRNKLVRSVHSFEGYQGAKTRYYPASRAGHAALAMARTHELGLAFTLGKPPSAFKNRSTAQPGSFVEYAILLRGGAPPEWTAK